MAKLSGGPLLKLCWLLSHRNAHLLLCRFILDLLFPFGASPMLWAAARRTPLGGFASQHAAAALFDRLHAHPEQKHEPGKLIEFIRANQPAGDHDLTEPIEEKRLACTIAGLRWLLTVLRFTPELVSAATQVPDADSSLYIVHCTLM